MLDSLVEQQVAIEMPKRRKLSPHAAPVDPMRKKLLEKLADVIPPGGHQQPLPLFQKLRELSDVGGIGR